MQAVVVSGPGQGGYSFSPGSLSFPGIRQATDGPYVQILFWGRGRPHRNIRARTATECWHSQGWVRDVNDRDQDEIETLSSPVETRRLQVSRREWDVEMHVVINAVKTYYHSVADCCTVIVILCCHFYLIATTDLINFIILTCQIWPRIDLDMRPRRDETLTCLETETSRPRTQPWAYTSSIYTPAW